RLFHELLLELLARQPERHIHLRAIGPARGGTPEARAIQLRVELAGLPLVHLADGLESALRLQPLQHEADGVDRKARRRVVERAVLRLHTMLNYAERASRS